MWCLCRRVEFLPRQWKQAEMDRSSVETTARKASEQAILENVRRQREQDYKGKEEELQRQMLEARYCIAACLWGYVVATSLCLATTSEFARFFCFFLSLAFLSVCLKSTVMSGKSLSRTKKLQGWPEKRAKRLRDWTE